ncbi:MAG: threonine ammonia-lyase [Maritimibacter sp.]
MLSHPDLDDLAGRRVWIKAEALQKTGSFKYRGARAAMSLLTDDELSRGVIAVSSGNHAQGVALAALELGTTALIIMPIDAPKAKIEATRALGAEIVFYDRETDDRETVAATHAKQRVLIRPYDDLRVIAGQGTVGLEIAQHAKGLGIKTAQVLVPCGGGGLSAGIALALAAEAPDLRLRTVEPIGFDDMARSLKEGAHATNEKRAGSICDAILTPTPGKLTFPILAQHALAGMSVRDEDSLLAMKAAHQSLGVTLEPGGAIALAAALFQPQNITGDDVIVVASGGNVDAALLAQALVSIG